MTLTIGDVLPAHHDVATVAASFIISVLGSYAAMIHAQHMFRRNGAVRWPVALGAAVSLGGIGIWTTHFTGMMAYRLPVAVHYEGFLTATSLIAAVLISGIALLLAGGRGRFSWGGWLVGSVLAAIGVCVMHYMGVYAMTLRANLALDLHVVAASALIAMAAAGAALWLVFHARTTTHRVAAALAMGVAVCAVHYTGMAAAEFICTAAAQKPFWSIDSYDLPPIVLSVAGGVLAWLGWNALRIAQDEQAPRRRTGAQPRKAPVATRPLDSSRPAFSQTIPGG